MVSVISEMSNRVKNFKLFEFNNEFTSWAAEEQAAFKARLVECKSNSMRYKNSRYTFDNNDLTTFKNTHCNKH